MNLDGISRPTQTATRRFLGYLKQYFQLRGLRALRGSSLFTTESSKTTEKANPENLPLTILLGSYP